MTEPYALDPDDLRRRFTYHPPVGEQPEVYEQIRSEARQLAEYIALMARANRESSLAITHLEQAVMWANASIARHGLRGQEIPA